MPFTIYSISYSDAGGGAENIAKNLHQNLIKNNFKSFLIVGVKKNEDINIIVLPNDACRNSFVVYIDKLLKLYESKNYKIKGFGRFLRITRNIGQPIRFVKNELGYEDFDYPAAKLIPKLTKNVPNIIHMHNLHGGYFDLRSLPAISQEIPTILTLHDAWLLSGHCAFSFDCQRWKSGCGECPDLKIYPPIKRDGTAFNWKMKNNIFKKSKLYIATPSKWLMDRVDESMLSQAIIEKRVIPNGINVSIFKPGIKLQERKFLNLDPDAFIMLTTANGIKDNIWKDFKTLRKSLEKFSIVNKSTKKILLAIGETGPSEMIGDVNVIYVPYINDLALLSKYYVAGDVYLHSAKIESFGNVLLEARACGTPVITTAVGGIPEHVKGLNWTKSQIKFNYCDISSADGILINSGDSDSFSNAINYLFENIQIRYQLGKNGSGIVRRNYSTEKQINTYIGWYKEIINSNNNIIL